MRQLIFFLIFQALPSVSGGFFKRQRMKVFSENVIGKVQASLTQCHLKCKLNDECIGYGTLQATLMGQITDCYLIRDDQRKYSSKDQMDTSIDIYVMEMDGRIEKKKGKEPATTTRSPTTEVMTTTPQSTTVEFVLGAAGDVVCPPGYTLVTDAATCKGGAATYLGHTSGNSGPSHCDNFAAAGCFANVNNRDNWFNTCDNKATHPANAPVCQKKEPSEPTISGESLSGTVWDWYHDGSKKEGTIEFTSDNKVKRNNGQPEGSWKVEGNIITATFSGIFHQLKINEDGTAAQLLTPKRNPPSKMTKQDLRVDRIPLTLYSANETSIVRNTILTTLPMLPKQYEISFDFKATKWIGGHSNVLRMTTGGNFGWGKRIPAFFVLDKKMVIANAIDGNGNWNFYSLPLTLNKWVHFRLIQRLEEKDYIYRAYMDEFLMKEKVNKKPRDFKQVELWLSDNWYNAQPGMIKNLFISELETTARSPTTEVLTTTAGLRCNGIDGGCCTETSPCTEGDGGCDDDNQCAGDLVCGSNENCPKTPSFKNDECCMKPKVCWTHLTRACVAGHNLSEHPSKTVDECKTLCVKEPQCKSFEYGVLHGGQSTSYKPGDCRLQSGSSAEGCDGGDLNLDLYIKRNCEG